VDKDEGNADSDGDGDGDGVVEEQGVGGRKRTT